MIGWIFLALVGGILGYVLFTSAGAALASSVTGLSIEPLTGTSLWTDWLTWSLGDMYGLLLLAGMGFVGLVLLLNATSSSGDIAR